jgi:hypothetical protein
LAKASADDWEPIMREKKTAKRKEEGNHEIHKRQEKNQSIEKGLFRVFRVFRVFRGINMHNLDPSLAERTGAFPGN